MTKPNTDDFIYAADLSEPTAATYAKMPDEQCAFSRRPHRCMLVVGHLGAHVLGTPEWERIEAVTRENERSAKRAAERHSLIDKRNDLYEKYKAAVADQTASSQIARDMRWFVTSATNDAVVFGYVADALEMLPSNASARDIALAEAAGFREGKKAVAKLANAALPEAAQAEIEHACAVATLKAQIEQIDEVLEPGGDPLPLGGVASLLGSLYIAKMVASFAPPKADKP